MTRDEFNQHVAFAAKAWVGTPYHHQQSAKGLGVDCLGLVRGVWREMCGPETEPMPNYSASWKRGGEDMLRAALDRHLIRVDGIATGRVLAFRYRQNQPITHLAVAVDETIMVHAYHGRGAAEVFITDYWRRHLTGCFEFPMAGHA